MTCLDSLQTRKTLRVCGSSYDYYELDAAYWSLGLDGGKIPFVLKILLENLLRHEDGVNVALSHLQHFAACVNTGAGCEMNFMPTRVIMQDFTGVPALVDLAAMRDYVRQNSGDSSLINPHIPVDLVIDHSVQVDFYGTSDSLSKNVALEMSRNLERYRFLKWGQSAFRNVRVVPPGTGICHQVNLEYLAKVVWDRNGTLCPDTVVGTDSHTTMINGISILGWGVGGIEAEAAMLGQPITIKVPEVVGCELRGELREGVTATDMVLTITSILRERNVVGKFVEFCGEGLESLSVFNRATMANMAPEYGATCGFFPFDQSVLDYLDITGRTQKDIDVVESYMRAQGLWYTGGEISYSDRVVVDLSSIQSVVAGPKMPQEKILLSQVSKALPEFPVSADYGLSVRNGDVVIAAITSCTNTSNPYVMVAAGIVAYKARELGLKSKPWVKTSLTPGSRVVEEYLRASGLQEHLDELGFNIAGYGCATCIGNSGPLAEGVESCIRSNNLLVASVLSGNRNFEGRIHPCVNANFLASPPLVVIYALAGTVLLDVMQDPICRDPDGRGVYLRDLWPSNREIEDIISRHISKNTFIERYSDVFGGDSVWKSVESGVGDTYNWDPESTYVQSPPYFRLKVASAATRRQFDVRNARVLMLLGDDVTTDHISPAGNISANSPAGEFLMCNGVRERDFNSYGARRGNHRVMVRGTLSNIRIRNRMLSGVEGGFTRHFPTGDVVSVFDAAMRYKDEHVQLLVIAGKRYGMGSSRDWAAKGTLLLGVKAVIAEGFERIHRSNLIGMGVLPLLFKNGSDNVFSGDEILTFSGDIGVNKEIKCKVRKADGSEREIPLICAVSTNIEEEYLASGGVLHYVLENMIKGSVEGAV
ncbi:MAG: aconitate hydratase AcnA [Anaplasma sp.]